MEHTEDKEITWQSLPTDLKKFCFNFLQPIDLVNAASVSKEFEQLASDEELWKQHYKK
jgi:hypothetical protein